MTDSCCRPDLRRVGRSPSPHRKRESSSKDESRPTMALSAGHKDSGPIGGGLPYRDACAVIVLTTSRSAGSQWTA